MEYKNGLNKDRRNYWYRSFSIRGYDRWTGRSNLSSFRTGIVGEQYREHANQADE